MGPADAQMRGTGWEKTSPRLFRWFLRITIALFVCCLVNGLIAWAYCHCSDTHGRFEHTDISIVARYAPSSNQLRPVTLERMRVTKGYRYPFFTREYYTTEVYLSTGPLSLEEAQRLFTDGPQKFWERQPVYLTEHGDTLDDGDVIHPIPPKIFVKSSRGELFATYKLDSLYQGNIDHVPSVPFLPRFHPLGWTKECWDYCD